MVEEIYKKLVCLSTYNDTMIDNEWATGEGITKCLNEIFGESASVIDCDLSSINNPVESVDLSGAESYDQEIEEIIKKSGLVKPIIAIWNTNSIKQQENRIKPIIWNTNSIKQQEDRMIHNDIIGGSHWQTIVIVPKEYRILDKIISHESECIFFRDSLNPGVSIPNNFVSYLRQQRFANLKVIENKHGNIQQETNFNDCGWWAIYNAIMFIIDGNTDFLNQFYQTIPDSGFKLRSIFNDFNLSYSSAVKSLNPSESFSRNETIQVADQMSFNNQQNHYMHLPKRGKPFNFSAETFEKLVRLDGFIDKTMFISASRRKN